MTNPPLSDDIALRVGLAARALEQVDAKKLLKVLLRLLGEPLTAPKLARLQARRLRQSLKNQHPGLQAAQFNAALGFLKGERLSELTCPAPDIPANVSCDLYGSVRVACASDSGEMIDGNFSQCLRFLIYQVSAAHFSLIDIREPRASVTRTRSKQEYQWSRAKLVGDCDLLYARSISAMAAAKAVKLGVHPLAFARPEPAEQPLGRLQQVLAGASPPPWLVKAMNHRQETPVPTPSREAPL